MGEHGVIMPTPLPLTSERLERHGLYLIEDGQTMFLWIGRDAVPQLVMDVFNLPNYDVLRGGKVSTLSLIRSAHPSDNRILPGDSSGTRKFVFTEGQCCRPKDTRNAPRGLSSLPLCSQGRRRATDTSLGTQLPHPRPCRPFT